MEDRGVTVHPWLDGRFPEVVDLEPRLRVFAFVAGHTASGNLDRLRQDWRHLAPQDQPGGFEVILQTHLFAGYPRAINALRVAHEIGVAAPLPPGSAEIAEAQPGVSWREAGESLCAAIYGPGYSQLRERMTRMHPAIDRWMVEIGYGRVLSRPGLSARERELCAIAVLAGMDVVPQLESHLRGALRVGATEAECRGVLDHTAAIWGDDAQHQVDSVWRRLFSR